MTYEQIINIVFICISSLITVMTLHYLFFSLVGLFAYKKFPKTDDKKKYGVIIPARNEEKVIANFIESIKRNEYPQDKLHIFVIAHNCTDRTAEICREAGVTVYEYNNPNEKTVGYAYKYLFDCIKRDYGIENFDGFFIFNADNILSKDFFDKMNDAYVACGGKEVITSFRNSKNFGSNVISGMYGLHFMKGCRLEFRGRTVLGCSTRVSGTGYVFNSEFVKDGWPYVTLTEDWEFSADQILQGHKIKYCDEAVFYDEQPLTIKIMLRQRLRWAKGHLLVYKTKAKQLIKNLFSRKGKNKGSTFDILINITPFGIIGFALSLIEIILLAFSPLFGLNLGLIALRLLKGTGITLAFSYLACMLNAVLIFIVERKRIKDVSFGKKILMVLCWPFFTFLNLPIQIVALFVKNVAWKAIPHTDNTTFDKLNNIQKDEQEVIEISQTQVCESVEREKEVKKEEVKI